MHAIDKHYIQQTKVLAYLHYGNDMEWFVVGKPPDVHNGNLIIFTGVRTEVIGQTGLLLENVYSSPADVWLIGAHGVPLAIDFEPTTRDLIIWTHKPKEADDSKIIE